MPSWRAQRPRPTRERNGDRNGDTNGDTNEPNTPTQVTPFLLESIRSRTGGKSLAANIALVKNNAAVGAQLAAELSALRAQAR
jgi:hypothetical protein